MTGDINMIRDAWINLADLVVSMRCGYPLEEEEPHTLDFVALQCRRFLEELEEYRQRQK